MKREHFDAIIEAIRLHLELEADDIFEIVVSLRNKEVYEGPWSNFKLSQDVIVLHHHQERPVFIALTAIATVSVRV